MSRCTREAIAQASAKGTVCTCMPAVTCTRGSTRRVRWKAEVLTGWPMARRRLAAILLAPTLGRALDGARIARPRIGFVGARCARFQDSSGLHASCGIVLGYWCACRGARSHLAQVEDEISLEDAARIAQTLGLAVPSIFEEECDQADDTPINPAVDISNTIEGSDPST